MPTSPGNPPPPSCLTHPDRFPVNGYQCKGIPSNVHQIDIGLFWDHIVVFVNQHVAASTTNVRIA